MDLRVLEHAKSYIDALARGVNPLTGEEVPENEVIQQVRISRCLFYVSDVLDEVLQNGGVRSVHREYVTLQPFSPQTIDFSDFPFFNYAVGIKAFSDAINAYCPEGMKKLNPTVVTNWLAEQGYLQSEIVNNKRRKRLAPLGAEIGIVEVERNGEYGKYMQLLYSESAQRFLLEHLPEIYPTDGATE